MSDDVFEAFGDDDIFSEEEEPKPEGDGQNRAFIIAVAILGGLLVCALASFAVWALVLSRPQEAIPDVLEPIVTETPAVEAIEATPTATLAPTETAEPTPTATPLLGPTSTPTPEEGDVAAIAEDEATPVVRRTPTPTSTPRADPTPTVATAVAAQELAQTGMREAVMIGAALLLIALMVLARRLRSA